MSTRRINNLADRARRNSGSIDLQGPLNSTGSTFVHEISEDLFDAPDGAAIMHACNCEGVWGAGIAATFATNYPGAYEIYCQQCERYKHYRETHRIPDINHGDSGRELSVHLPLGTALIIPPQEIDFHNVGHRHWVICLFVSTGYGRHVDPAPQILNSLHAALLDLRLQLQVPVGQVSSSQPLALYGNRFCSGLFRVRWDLVCQVIENVGLHITVCHL